MQGDLFICLVISETAIWLSSDWKLSDPDTIAYRHGVNLPFDLLIPCQGSFQTFFGVELRVSTLVDVSTNPRHSISLCEHNYQSITLRF